MKTQNYLCVDVKTHTHETIQEDHALFGMMEMIEQDERFEFQEIHLPLAPYRFRADIRNPKLYDGPLVSLVHKRNGKYQFHVRELDDLPRTYQDQRAFLRALREDVQRALRSAQC